MCTFLIIDASLSKLVLIAENLSHAFLYQNNYRLLLLDLYIFRKGPKGGKLYYDPNIMPPIIYALYVINMAVSITWTVLFDRQQLVASLVVIAMFPLTLWIMIFFACRALVNHGQELYNNGMRKEIWLLRILVHNALGIYATWTTIATLLSLAITLTYRGPEIANDISSTIALALLSGIALFYYVLDFCFIERYVRFLLTPYIVVPGALVGIITHNWDPTKRNFIFTAVLLGVTSVFGLIKLIITLYKSLYRPLFVAEKIQDSQDAKISV